MDAAVGGYILPLVDRPGLAVVGLQACVPAVSDSRPKMRTNSLQQDPVHVRLHVLPSPMFNRKLPPLLGYLTGCCVVSVRASVRRADKVRHDAIDVAVVDLHRLSGQHCALDEDQEDSRRSGTTG